MKRFNRYALVVALGFLFLLTRAADAGPGEHRRKTAAPEKPGGELIVHFMDVGHGDAILIQTPDGKNILIDSGVGEAVWSKRDMGKIKVLPYLRKLGVEALDMLIISHAHYDHIGGMAYLIDHIKVGQVIDSGYPHTTQAYRDLLIDIKEKGISYRNVRSGDTLPFGKMVGARVLHPSHTEHRWGKRAYINNYSLVIRMTYGDVSFLFTGDLEEEGERALLRSRYPVRSSILKVGHHGSKTSSSYSFINAVRPGVAIVSCGRRPKFKSEKPGRNLRAIGARIYRTDLHGTVVVSTDGKTYSVAVERD